MLSDAALRRLVHYCRRVEQTPSEFVDVDGRNVRYVGGELRRLVWRDVEVRDALLAAGDDCGPRGALAGALEAVGAVGFGLNLLDLVTAMSLEAAESPQGTARVPVCRRSVGAAREP
jgi:hypothetical protein